MRPSRRLLKASLEISGKCLVSTAFKAVIFLSKDTEPGLSPRPEGDVQRVDIVNWSIVWL
uniref:Uncharacterized protein n=1 Tax=Lepeophtheirus salmonis TaxID=72036 RepID=A0A0K2VCG8_LEPSM